MIRSANPDMVRPYLKDAANLTGGYANEEVFPEEFLNEWPLSFSIH